MASGSTAPFSGEFVDLENVPKLPEGISAEQILEQNADAIRQVAEARHAAGLSQVEADGGFFDAFVSSSKVSSQSKTVITSGSNGVTKLSVAFSVLEDFEGASISDSDIFVNAGSSSDVNVVSSGGVIEGSDALELSPTDDFLKVGLTPPSSRLVRGRIRPQSFPTGNVDDKIVFELDSSSDGRRRVILHGDGDISAGEFNSKGGNTVVGSYSSNDIVDVEIDVRGSNSVFSVNDTTVETSSSGYGGDPDELNLVVTTSIGGGSSNEIFDIIEFGDGFNTSGTITEQQFTFSDTQGNSFSPSKVGIFPDQTLNGQSITYDLKDSTGTVVKTFNQADLNQLISVSTTDDTFQVEANLSGNGSQTPELEFLDVRGV